MCRLYRCYCQGWRLFRLLWTCVGLPLCAVVVVHALVGVVSACQGASYDTIKKTIKAACDGPMKGIMGYTDHAVVSSDFMCVLSVARSAGFTARADQPG